MPEVFCAWLKCLWTMERDDWNDLLHWKKSESRKPLIIRGARQVGKTWLMKEFGRTEYDQYAYVNFESNSVLRNLFKENFDIHRVITAIQIETRSEEHTSELQSLMRISYAVFCLKKKNSTKHNNTYLPTSKNK